MIVADIGDGWFSWTITHL